MIRRFMTWALLLFLGTACPSTWGKEGYVQKTLHKNVIQEALGHSSCRLTPEQWLLRCGGAVDHSGGCPDACPLGEELHEEGDEEW
jgi:hypothetical protein